MNVDKATFYANQDTVKLLEIANRNAYASESYNLTDMCASGRAIAEALTVMQQIGAPVTDAYNEAQSQRDTFSAFVKKRVDTANMLMSNREADYAALSEITSRALLGLIKQYPTATREIKLATHFCKIVAKIRDTKSSLTASPTISTLSDVVAANKSSLDALESFNCVSEKIRNGNGVFNNVALSLSQMDTWNAMAVFATNVTKVLKIFPLSPIDVAYCDTLGYSACRVQDDCGFDKIAPINFKFSNHYGTGFGESGKVIGDNFGHSYSSSMFWHEPFLEEILETLDLYRKHDFSTAGSSTITEYASKSVLYKLGKNATSSRAEAANRVGSFYERYYGHKYQNPASCSLPYRHFVFAELCLVRLLLRERNAFLNALQAERAEAVSVALWTALNAAKPAYVRETEAAREAAEAAKPKATKPKAAKPKTQKRVKVSTPKGAKTPKNTPKK